jgi:RNA binding exosome subunit
MLHIDPETRAIIRFEEHVKPPSITDIEAEVQKLKGAAGRREEVFQKSVEQHKNHQNVLNKKFDEMLRLAKENPDAPPPKRDIDFD